MALLRLHRSRLAALSSAGACLLATLALPTSDAGPGALADAQAVHAAFTLNLTRFMAWPAMAFAAPSDPLVIGTFPRDPINERLDSMVRGQAFHGRPIVTVRIRSLDEVPRCHVIFMSSNVVRQPLVLERCARRPILTVSDAEGFLELGGHVRFVAQPPHTKLQISVTNLKLSGLEARPQLLRLAAAP